MQLSIDEILAENERLKAELTASVTEHAEYARNADIAKQKSMFLEAMLETMPVGVVMAHAPSGKILMGNKRAEELVRHAIFESDDVDSYGEWISYHENGTKVQSHEYPLSQVIKDGKDYSELDVNYQRGDGTKFWMRIIGRPVMAENGEVVGAAVALLDIDHERHLIAQQEILIGELNHRVKNAFTVVKSIVSQSLRGSETTPDVRDTIDSRLGAYAKAHSQLIGNRWDRALISNIANDTIGQISDGRISFTGPDIELPSKIGLSLSMAFYELATNALKHGSLSVPDGYVSMIWGFADASQKSLIIEWMEHNGPQPVEPKTKGFGSRIIGRVLAAETGGKVSMAYPETGYEWKLEMPLENEDEDHGNGY